MLALLVDLAIFFDPLDDAATSRRCLEEFMRINFAGNRIRQNGYWQMFFTIG